MKMRKRTINTLEELLTLLECGAEIHTVSGMMVRNDAWKFAWNCRSTSDWRNTQVPEWIRDGVGVYYIYVEEDEEDEDAQP